MTVRMGWRQPGWAAHFGYATPPRTGSGRRRPSRFLAECREGPRGALEGAGGHGRPTAVVIVWASGPIAKTAVSRCKVSTILNIEDSPIRSWCSVECHVAGCRGVAH